MTPGMTVAHICGIDEVLQLDSRRPAIYHVADVIEWAFDPRADPGVFVARWFCAAVSFVVGFVGGEWPTSWSSTQAQWGALKVVDRTTAWATGRVGAAVIATTAVAADSIGGPTLACACTACEVVAREVHGLVETRMTMLYPQVVFEWGGEVFGKLGALCRLLLTLGCLGSSTKSEPEIG